MCACSYASVPGHVGASRLRIMRMEFTQLLAKPIPFDLTFEDFWDEVPYPDGQECPLDTKPNWTNKIPRHLPSLEGTYFSKFTHRPTTRFSRGWITLIYERTETGRNFFKVISIIYFFTCAWSGLSLQVGLYRVIAYIAFWAGAWFGEFGVLWIDNTLFFFFKPSRIWSSCPWHGRWVHGTK